MRERRKANGEWRTFPFWYTVLALTEMNSAGARAELKHAARRIEAEAKRPPKATAYAARRNAPARRALARL